MNSTPKKYSLFIGRYQCFHLGHMYIFETELKKGNPVLIAVRDVIPDENNPFTASQVKFIIEKAYSNEISSGMVKVIIIPDINGVYYGRGVGYDVVNIQAPENFAQISATEILQNFNNGRQRFGI